MKVRPLDDRLLVKPIEVEERTAGGIVIPDTAKEKPQIGTVEALGPGPLLKDGKRGALSVKKGDRVWFGKYAGSDIKLDGIEYKILRESDVLAKEE